MAQFVAQTVGNESPDYSSGAAAAAGLIHTRSKLDELKMNLDNMKTKRELGLQSQQLDYMQRIANSDSLQEKRLLANMLSSFNQKNGLSEDSPDWRNGLDYVLSRPGAAQNIEAFKNKYPQWATDPNQGASFRTAVTRMLNFGGGDASQIDKDIADVGKMGSSIDETKIKAQAMGGRQQNTKNSNALRTFQQADSSKIVQGSDVNLAAGQKDLDQINQYLKKGKPIPRSLYNEITPSLAGMLVPVSSAVVPQGRAESFNANLPVLTGIKGRIDQELTQNPNANTISMGSTQMLANMLTRLVDNTQHIHDFALAKKLNNGVLAGTINDDQASSKYDSDSYLKGRNYQATVGELNHSGTTPIGSDTYEKIIRNKQMSDHIAQHHQAGTSLNDINKAIKGNMTQDEYDLIGKAGANRMPQSITDDDSDSDTSDNQSSSEENDESQQDTGAQ